MIQLNFKREMDLLSLDVTFFIMTLGGACTPSMDLNFYTGALQNIIKLTVNCAKSIAILFVCHFDVWVDQLYT